jgi:carboxypeptidase family protein/TonB-dependent receptor-like protein
MPSDSTINARARRRIAEVIDPQKLNYDAITKESVFMEKGMCSKQILKMIALCALTLCTLAVRPAEAQTAAANGSLKGLITDSAGSFISGADVSVTETATGISRRTKSDAEGAFEFLLLPLGAYRLQIKAQGFADFNQTGIVVNVGRASVITAALQIASQQEAVNVQADASILTTDSAAVIGVMNQKSMENMPITSRNVQNLALFAPGLAGRRDDEFGTTQFAFGGLQRRAFTVDGADNTQRGGQLRLGVFSPEAIREIQVVSNAFSAEYGRTVGGIVNMVTRGGTNDYHGGFLYLARRPGLIARPSLAATKPFSQWATYSGSFGGPVIRDRWFFFGNGEYEPLDGPRPITITATNAAALSLPATELGNAPFAQRFRTFLGRADFQINPRLSGFVRYDYFFTPSKFNTSGGLIVRSAGNNFDDRQDSTTFQLTAVAGARGLNEFRFGDLRRKFFRPPVSGRLGPVISILNVAQLGSNDAANQSYLERQEQFVDNFTWKAGRHTLKFGGDLNTVHIRQEDRLSLTFLFNGLTGVTPLQQYLNTINNVANPATGKPFTYTQLTQSFGDNVADHRTQSYNFFAQDDLQLARRLTLSLGLRYELLDYPRLSDNAPIETSRRIRNDANNFAPRLGFAYSLNDRTVARGGYGLFYDTTNLRLLSAVIRNNGVAVQTIVIPGADAAAPLFPNPLSTPAANFAVKPSVMTFADDFRSMYAHQANMQIERELTRDLAVTVGYQFFGAHRLPLTRDVNLGAPVSFLADGRPVYDRNKRPDARFNQITEIQSVGNANYHGGFVSVNKRFSRGFQFTASYTLSKAINDNDATGDTGSPVSDPSNVALDRGKSSSDQRHRFVLQGVWEPRVGAGRVVSAMVNGFVFSPNLTLTSGFRVNVVAGQDLNGDLVNNDRPLFRGRNDVEGPGFQEFNLRVSRNFKLYGERLNLEIIGEAENLFNHTNAACGVGGCVGAVVNRFGASDFLRVTSATNSRQIQLGGRIRF